jgi:hypothetical protein
MCIRLGRQCSGLDDGPLIIDMTQKARYGMQKRKKKASPQVPVLEVHARGHHASINRISQQAMVTEAFYGRFISYFTSEGDGKDIRNKVSWLHRLPQLSVDGSNDALALAVQATASSYCAVETHNPALTRQSWDLYGQAIRIHSRSLARSRMNSRAVTLHMISTSVLFSFFEAMQATNANAYRLHVYGAAKMFEVTNPRQCSQGVLCQIFFHIRTQLAFVQLTSNGKKTPLDVKKILYDALDYEELPIFQRLTTHFTKLADVYSDMEIAGGREDKQHSTSFWEYVDCKAEIDILWDEYTNAASLASEILMWYDPSTNTTQYRDAFTALTIAYFSATRVLLCVTAPQSSAFYLDLVDHCRSILQAALYMQTCSIGCAYMRMAAPLLLVALHTPNLDQRRVAIGCFESWEKGSMRGISELALEAVHGRLSETKRLKPGDDGILIAVPSPISA